MAKYRLLKDLPDVKSGIDFYKYPSRNFYITERNYEYLLAHESYFGQYWAKDPTYHMNIVENKPDWFLLIEEDKGRDWEILAYKDAERITDIKGADIIQAGHIRYYIASEKNFPIHSVRRLSDGEVFSVGDECTYDNKDYWPLVGFEIYDNKMMVLGEVILDSGQKDIWRKCELSRTIKKQKPEQPKEFQWDDNSVLEAFMDFGFKTFLRKMLTKEEIAHCIKRDIESFKKSKQSIKEERIEVSMLQHRPGTIDQYKNIFYTSLPVHKNKFPLIQEAIERIVNNESYLQSLNTQGK